MSHASGTATTAERTTGVAGYEIFLRTVSEMNLVRTASEGRPLS